MWCGDVKWYLIWILFYIIWFNVTKITKSIFISSVLIFTKCHKMTINMHLKKKNLLLFSKTRKLLPLEPHLIFIVLLSCISFLNYRISGKQFELKMLNNSFWYLTTIQKSNNSIINIVFILSSNAGWLQKWRRSYKPHFCKPISCYSIKNLTGKYNL